MSLCGLGISCEPVTDIKEVCEHGIVVTFPCDWCAIQKEIIELRNRINALHEHKLRQIDENRKMWRRVDALERHMNDENVNKRRIDELEAAYKADFEVAKDIIFEGARTHASILKCEKGLKDLEQLFYDEKAKFRCNDKKPYKCPICNGKGNWKLESLEEVARNEGINIKNCIPCESKGIVWG